MSRRNVSISLLRHGETEGGTRYCGSTDVALTAAGWRQMWRAVDGKRGWEAIHCSPLVRCAAFARALGKQQHLPVYVDERLREMDFGDWEKKSAAGLLATDTQALGLFWQDPWNHAPPHGESLPELQRRVCAAWREIAAHGRPVLIVSHGGPLRIILSHVRRYPRQRLLEMEVPHASIFRVHVASTSGHPSSPVRHGA